MRTTTLMTALARAARALRRGRVAAFYKRHEAGAIIAGIVVAIVLGLWARAEWMTARTRFRLTIEVETAEGLRSGSSVFATATAEGPTWGPPDTQRLSLHKRGEAVLVDLGEGRLLLALLLFGPHGISSAEGIYDLLGPALAPRRRVSWQDAPKLRGRGDVPAEYMPLFATFDDPRDPASARVVEPGEFAAVFGPGVSFRRAWVETTDAPVVFALKERLPWVEDGPSLHSFATALLATGFDPRGSFYTNTILQVRD